MNYNEILAAAKDCVGPYCKACPVCNGRACGNSMPGPGCKYPGNVAARNFDKWQEICVNMDTLCPNATPDVSFDFLEADDIRFILGEFPLDQRFASVKAVDAVALDVRADIICTDIQFHGMPPVFS